MTKAFARAVMRLAACSLGEHRREWALAMQSEFEAAAEDGKPLSFAIGCLAGAWRRLPADEPGRFLLANYVLVLGLILPAAAAMLSTIVTGFPSSHFGQFGAHGALPASSGHGPLLSDANLSAVPSLAVLVLLLAAAHLRIAWLLLERDWPRVADCGSQAAALTVTLAIFSGLVFVSDTGLVHAAVVAVELAAVLVLARWHARLRPGALPGAGIS